MSRDHSSTSAAQMNKSIFATVGTTSFDDFIQSLCSLPFLTAMAIHHLHNAIEVNETSLPSVSYPSSLHSQSVPLSPSDVSAPGQSQSSCLTSSLSSPAVVSSSTSIDMQHCDEQPSQHYDMSITIQYGRGQCPYLFLPPTLFDTSTIQRSDDDSDDGSGSIILSIPVLDSTNDAPNTTHSNTKPKQHLYQVQMQWYRFIPSLSAEMERAGIILCHAGAGTLLEALAISSSTTKSTEIKQKKIINAVINSKLMDNHQTELAEELEKRNHICVTRDCTTEWTTQDDATKFWKDIGEFTPVPFLGGQRSMNGIGEQSSNQHVSSFQRIVDGVMGFSDNGRKTH